MLEELIDSQLLLPLIVIGAFVLAVVFFRLGWSFKAFGARRRETALHKDIRDAKASVPQLESIVRSREQLVARLQDELQAQKERSIQLQTEHAERERQLKSAQTEVRHLTHELSAIKGKSVDSRDIDLEMLGEDSDIASEATSPLAEKLKATEQLYEKLKTALIERAARIEELERLLKDAARDSSADEPAMLSNQEIDALHRQLDQRNRSISELNAQVAQLKQEKDMIEELAQKRSKSNRSLKDSKSDVEARKLELEQAVEAHQKTISDRELSIHRLLIEVQVVRKNLRESVEEADSLKRANQAKEEALAEALQAQQSLEQAISEHEAKLIAQQLELESAQASIVLLKQEVSEFTHSSRIQSDTPEVLPVDSGKHPEPGTGQHSEVVIRLSASTALETELGTEPRTHQAG